MFSSKHYLLNLFVLLWIGSRVKPMGNYGIRSIYHDLRQLNAFCNNGTTCPSQFTNAVSECNCDVNCVYYKTCCFNSQYIDFAQPTLKPTCRQIAGGSFYHMFDRCPTSDSVWDSLCREEWNGTDDIIRIVPVTSLSTHITYKNYFCFRCQEDNDRFYFWNVRFATDNVPNDISEEEKQYSSFNYAYEIRSWIVSFRSNSVQIPVSLSLEIPVEISSMVKACNPFIISTCSKYWTNSDINEKCQSYMGVRAVRKGGSTLAYKNMHCALCNFEDLNDISCFTEVDFYPPSVAFCCPDGKEVFAFSKLLDINPSGGERVGRYRLCDDNSVWDSFANTCRRLTCAFPGYQVQNGRCVRG